MVTHEKTGWEIRFNRRGQRKTVSAKNDLLYGVIVALPEVLRKGTVVESNPDWRGRQDVLQVHTVEATISFEGRPVALRATIAERTDGTGIVAELSVEA